MDCKISESSQSSVSPPSLNAEESDDFHILYKADESENESTNLKIQTFVEGSKVKRLQLPLSKGFIKPKLDVVASAPDKCEDLCHRPVYYARKSNPSKNSYNKCKETYIPNSQNLVNTRSPQTLTNVLASDKNEQTSIPSDTINKKMISSQTNISPKMASNLSPASKGNTANSIPKTRFMKNIPNSTLKHKAQKTESLCQKEANKVELIKNLLSLSETEKQPKKTVDFPVSASNVDSSSDIPNLNSIEIIDDSCSEEELIECSPKILETSFKKNTEKPPNISSQTKTITSAGRNITKSTSKAEKVTINKLPSVMTSKMLLPKASITQQLSKKNVTNVSLDNSALAKHNDAYIATPSQGNVIVQSPLPASINFVVPRTEIIRCKQANVPLILAVPPLMPSGSSPQVAGNLLMVLPNQLPQNIPPKGAVNFLVSTATVKGNASSQNIVSGSQVDDKLLRNIHSEDKSLNKSTSSLSTPTQVSQREGGKTTELESSPKVAHSILNTKEKDGPVWCWYASKVGKRDLDGFLYRDRLGFSKGEVNQVKRCLKKLGMVLNQKLVELDILGSKIGQLTHTRYGTDEKENISGENNTKLIKSKTSYAPVIKNTSLGIKRKLHDRSLNESNEDNDTVSLPSSNSNFNDEDGSELYYTKKVVILRNNAPRKKSKRPKRIPKIKLRSSYKKSSPQKSDFKRINSLPAVKNCSVILERDPRVEEEFRRLTENSTGRPSRKRKLDLESMGLIKKVRRRNAIDTSNITMEVHNKIKSDKSQEFGSASVHHAEMSEESESYIIPRNTHDDTTSKTVMKDGPSDYSKASRTTVKKVSMSYREYQKIIKLSQTEVNFIFILNTIQSLDEFRINENKPLLILDRFNYELDFDHINDFNVIFTRDDGEVIPSQLLKNFEFVYYVRHGYIKVVSRPVLCKYILERNDCFKKVVKETVSVATEKQRNEKIKKRDHKIDDAKERFVKTLSLTRRVTLDKNSGTTTKGGVINVRQDLMQSSSAQNLSNKKVTHSRKIVGKYTTPNNKDDKRKQNRTSKKCVNDKEISSSNLDIKFDEIENNLSKMFGKIRQHSSDVTNSSPELICPPAFNDFSNGNNRNTMNVEKIVDELSADLDYLLSNSTEETVNLDNSSEETKIDIVQHVVTETDLGNKSSEGSPKKWKRNSSLIDKNPSKESGLVSDTNMSQNVQLQENVDIKNRNPSVANKKDTSRNSHITMPDTVDTNVSTGIVGLLDSSGKENDSSSKCYQTCTFTNQNEDNVFELTTDSSKREAVVSSTNELIQNVDGGISKGQSDIISMWETVRSKSLITTEEIDTCSNTRKSEYPICDSTKLSENIEKPEVFEQLNTPTDLPESDCSEAVLKNNIVDLDETMNASGLIENSEDLIEKSGTAGTQEPIKETDDCLNDSEGISGSTLDVSEFLIKNASIPENNTNQLLDVDLFLTKDDEVAQTSIKSPDVMLQLPEDIGSLKSIEDTMGEESCTKDENSFKTRSLAEASISKECGSLEKCEENLENSSSPNHTLEEVSEKNIASSNAPDIRENSQSQLYNNADEVIELSMDTVNTDVSEIQDTTPPTSLETSCSVLDRIIKETMCDNSNVKLFDTSQNKEVDSTSQEVSIFEVSALSESNNILSSHIKSNDTENSLGDNKMGEIVSELAIHNNEVSKNLPDDYLEK